MRARHIALALVVGLATAALLVGPASAVRPDDKAGMHGVGAVTAQAPATPIRPDDRAGVRGPARSAPASQLSVAVRPDDRGDARGPGAHVQAPATVATADDGGAGFDWGNTLGAAGFVLLLGLFAGMLVYNGRLERRPI